MKFHKFIDTVLLHAVAGKGGNGVVSFRREKFIPKGGPDGGDGGDGGNVYLIGDYDEDSLINIFYRPYRKAENGKDGSGGRRHGKNGQDLYIKVPLGTEVWNKETSELVGDIVSHNQKLLIAKGGKGGLGNVHWKSATHQTPYEYTLGEETQEITFRLEFKIPSEAALVGYPNAGKSSIITKLSHAHPKIASYPFTTLNPIIGTLKYEDFFSLKIADIPGLIKGAHSGTGLGHKFLRHIERAEIIIFVIDMAAVDQRKPFEDYFNLKEEINLYNKDILKRPQIVIANKMDIPEAQENLKEFIEKTEISPIKISTLNNYGLDEIKTVIRAKYDIIHKS